MPEKLGVKVSGHACVPAGYGRAGFGNYGKLWFVSGAVDLLIVDSVAALTPKAEN